MHNPTQTAVSTFILTNIIHPRLHLSCLGGRFQLVVSLSSHKRANVNVSIIYSFKLLYTPMALMFYKLHVLTNQNPEL